MNTATNTEPTAPAADEIDDRIAAEYLAQVRGEPTGSFTSRLMEMAEEARVVDPRGKEILMRAAREMAAWELMQK